MLWDRDQASLRTAIQDSGWNNFCVGVSAVTEASTMLT